MFVCSTFFPCLFLFVCRLRIALRIEIRAEGTELGEEDGLKRTTLEGNMFCACVTRILKTAERKGNV